jgi:hypothetical protein
VEDAPLSLRRAALAAVAVAALSWGAAVRPAREALAAAQEQFGRARDERERLRLRTALLERHVAAHARLAGATGPGPGDPAKALRLFVVGAVSQAPLSDVRLEASPGRGATAARVRLSALGSFHEILRLGERLVGQGSGLALERVSVSAAGSGRVRAEIEGFTLGTPSP